MSAWVGAADAAQDAPLEFRGNKHGHAELPFGKRYGLTMTTGCLARNLTAFRRSRRKAGESAVVETDFGRLRARLKEDKRDGSEDLGGFSSFEYPEIARRLMERELDDTEHTGTRVLATDNQNCIMHLCGGCDAAGRPPRVVYFADFAAERLRERERAVSPS